MPRETNIGWTDHTWNPFSGCVEVSEGCNHCYAKVIAEKYRGTKAYPNGFDLTLRPHKIPEPLKWKEPSEIFVNSMSDFWLGTVPPEYIKDCWNTMLEADWHVFQILTKRPVNMLRMIREYNLELAPHIWLGVSVENQRWADNRIPLLLEVPTPGVRFLSCEPLLGPIDLRCIEWQRHDGSDYFNALEKNRPPFDDVGLNGVTIDWVIDGGESGPGHRLADPDWFRGIRDACVSGGVDYYHKQGNHHFSGRDRELDGRTWDQHPNRVARTDRIVDRTNDRTNEPDQARFDLDVRTVDRH